MPDSRSENLEFFQEFLLRMTDYRFLRQHGKVTAAHRVVVAAGTPETWSRLEGSFSAVHPSCWDSLLANKWTKYREFASAESHTLLGLLVYGLADLEHCKDLLVEVARERDRLEAEGQGPVVACAFLADAELEGIDIWKNLAMRDLFFDHRLFLFADSPRWMDEALAVLEAETAAFQVELAAVNREIEAKDRELAAINREIEAKDAIFAKLAALAAEYPEMQAQIEEALSAGTTNDAG